MKKLLLAFIILTGLGFYSSGCSTSAEYSADTEELWNQFQPMINMMEKGLYTDFINMYVDPRLVQRKDGASAMLTEFNMAKREQLLRVLKAAKNMQPTLNTVQKIATYDAFEFPFPLRFQKIGDRWYLLDSPSFENN
jgi:hypothetical protein